jgi:hypothetical protein
VLRTLVAGEEITDYYNDRQPEDRQKASHQETHGPSHKSQNAKLTPTSTGIAGTAHASHRSYPPRTIPRTLKRKRRLEDTGAYGKTIVYSKAQGALCKEPG